MYTIVDLLKEKNRYLDQFAQLSRIECDRICLGNFNHINDFYHSRKILLDSIESVDALLGKCKIKYISESEKKTIFSLLQKKQEIILSILHIDFLIHFHLSHFSIDTVKDQIA